MSFGSDRPGVRPAAVAGSWYTGDPRRLKSRLEAMLDAAEPWKSAGRLRGLITPHAGLEYSGPTASHVYLCVEPGDFARVVVLAPAHRSFVRGAAVDPSSAYETPLGRMLVDQDAVEALSSRRGFTGTTRPFEREHAIEMQLPFLQLRLPKAQLVPVLVGDLRPGDHEELAAGLSTLLDRHTLMVVSSDFVHYGPNYGYVPFVDDVPAKIRNLDRRAIDALERRDFEAFQSLLEGSGATICGRMPLGVFLLLAPPSWKGELRHYTTSGEITGDYTNSVSYAGLVYCEDVTEPETLATEAERRANEGAATPAPVTVGRVSEEPLTPEERCILLGVARRAIESFCRREGDTAETSFEAITPRLRRRWSGVFVSLHRRRGHRLRGCIGSLEPRGPLVESVAQNARAAASRDPRFDAVRAEELPDLEIEISVLGPLLPVEDAAEIIVGRDGLVVSDGILRGVLLPQVATSQHWDVLEFLENTCRKAELPADAWKTGAQVERFEAEIFAESEVPDQTG